MYITVIFQLNNIQSYDVDQLFLTASLNTFCRSTKHFWGLLE